MNMNPELVLDCDDAKTHDTIGYTEIVALDIKCLCENEKHKHLVEDVVKAKCAKSKIPFAPSSHANKPILANVISPSNSVPYPGSIPKLTQKNCDLLNTHEGCYKCHHFYVTHKSNTCPHGFPDAMTYKLLTKVSALVAKRKSAKAVVAAVEIESNTLAAAVGMSSAVIGDGTDLDEYVDPMHFPHIY